MGLAFFLATYSVSTVLVAGILFWRYKREPEKHMYFLCMMALWLSVPAAVLFVPRAWTEMHWMRQSPGHPSWLNVVTLLVIAGAVAYECWRNPAVRRRNAMIWLPILTLLTVLQIVYPLLWER